MTLLLLSYLAKPICNPDERNPNPRTSILLNMHEARRFVSSDLSSYTGGWRVFSSFFIFNSSWWKMIQMCAFLHWHYQTLFLWIICQTFRWKLSEHGMKAIKIWSKFTLRLICIYLNIMIIYDVECSSFAYSLQIMIIIMINLQGISQLSTIIWRFFMGNAIHNYIVTLILNGRSNSYK